MEVKIKNMKIAACDRSVWGPLEDVVEAAKCQNFMFIGCVTLGELKVYLYKHRNTRRYLNLDWSGNAYKFVKGKYVPVKLSDALDHVFS